MSLKTIAASFQTFAEEVVADAVAEAGEVGAKLVVIGKDAAEKAGNAIEGAFEDLVGKLGLRATELVTNLFSDDSLSGLEKANLATTQLVEHAATESINLAAHDATALIKSAYLAVKDKLKDL